MKDRPPVNSICYISAEGNPHQYIVGRGGVTEIREVEESSEYSFVPWVEVWAGRNLLARFNQHKLEHILYAATDTLAYGDVERNETLPRVEHMPKEAWRG